MNYLPMIRALLLSVALIVPTLHGMLEVTVTSEELPVQLRHRGYTPLHIAAYFGRADTIAELIAAAGPADALVRAKNCSGSTPLHVAAEQGHVGVVEILIANDRSKALPSDPSLCNIRDTAGLTPLACAAKNGHIDVIRCLIAHGAKISKTDKYGNLPFHRATQIGHLEAMEILEPKDGLSDELNLLTLHTAIPCAIESGKPEALASVKHMIEERHSPETEIESDSKWYNCSKYYNYRGVTPLLNAAASGHVSMMQWSLEHDDARIDEIDSYGNCALHFAARYGHTDAVQFLLERNAELVKIKNDANTSEKTALHGASEGGHTKVMDLLLQYNAEINAQDRWGSTALHIAAEKGHAGVLEQLIASGASLTIADERGRTSLHRAASAGQKDCVEILLAATADIEAKDGLKRTPLLSAAEEGHLELIKCLLRHGADIKQQTNSGNALMIAAMGNHIEVMRYLLDNTEIELTSCSNWFPGVAPVIFSAARAGHYKASSLLIKKGASLDTKLSDGRTVLHCAAENYQTSLHNSGVVRLLLRAGADMLCLDYAGLTPLDGLQLSQHQLPAATTYFQNRSLYLSGKLRPEDNLNSVFYIAADFLDIPVLEALKDQLGDRLIQWRLETRERNLLMVAIIMHDLDGMDWLLDQKICDMSHKDSNGHDVLSIAIDSTRSKNNTTRLSLINKLLEAGAVVTERHLIDEANRSNSEVDELLMRLLVTYRYSQRPVHERLSLFK